MTPPNSRRRVLVAGIGNVLRGDDGFGPAVIQALQALPGLFDGVRAVEMGIGGLGLVHELMDGYDLLILIDAVNRGGTPGSLYMLEPEVPDPADLPDLARHELATDMHEAVPERALIVARAAGVLPPVVRIVGCQPGDTDAFSMELSGPVRQAVPKAVAAILALMEPERR